MAVGICEMLRIWIIVVKWSEWDIIIDIKVSFTKRIKICLSWHSVNSYYSIVNFSLRHDYKNCTQNISSFKTIERFAVKKYKLCFQISIRMQIIFKSYLKIIAYLNYGTSITTKEQHEIIVDPQWVVARKRN